MEFTGLDLTPTRLASVREALGLSRSQVAREGNLQQGTVSWIEKGRFVPYESQAEKIVGVLRAHGWAGDETTLFEKVK